MRRYTLNFFFSSLLIRTALTAPYFPKNSSRRFWRVSSSSPNPFCEQKISFVSNTISKRIMFETYGIHTALELVFGFLGFGCPSNFGFGLINLKESTGLESICKPFYAFLAEIAHAFERSDSLNGDPMFRVFAIQRPHESNWGSMSC